METTINVTDEKLFLDLVEYTKLPVRLCFERCNYAFRELAALWHKKNPKNQAEILEYYRKNEELYLFDLTTYQLMMKENVKMMLKQMKELGVKKVLEFGGGTGEFTIQACQAGFEAAYFDLDGEIKNYALWRFKKHGVNPKVIDEKTDPLAEEWDLVNAMDVLEHLEKPEEVIKKLKEKTKYIFVNPEEIKYNLFYPQHISKYELNGFENIEEYLWKLI